MPLGQRRLMGTNAVAFAAQHQKDGQIKQSTGHIMSRFREAALPPSDIIVHKFQKTIPAILFKPGCLGTCTIVEWAAHL